jgi:hypothetical protein
MTKLNHAAWVAATVSAALAQAQFVNRQMRKTLWQNGKFLVTEQGLKSATN